MIYLGYGTLTVQKYGTNDFTVVHVNIRSLSKNRSTFWIFIGFEPDFDWV